MLGRAVAHEWEKRIFLINFAIWRVVPPRCEICPSPMRDLSPPDAMDFDFLNSPQPGGPGVGNQFLFHLYNRNHRFVNKNPVPDAPGRSWDNAVSSSDWPQIRWERFPDPGSGHHRNVARCSETFKCNLIGTGRPLSKIVRLSQKCAESSLLR